MRKVYICSPYRAKDGAELDRNIDYAQQLTRQALEAGLAPITPHLYMTQCMDDKKPEERARGMAAGLALLKGCDFVIAGVKYGITEGMDREIHTANTLGIAVIDASQIKAYMRYEEKRQERAASDYAKLHECKHCYERRLCSLTVYYCDEAAVGMKFVAGDVSGTVQGVTHIQTDEAAAAGEAGNDRTALTLSKAVKAGCKVIALERTDTVAGMTTDDIAALKGVLKQYE